MNVNIRDYIKNNFKDSDELEIKQSIIDSIESNDEVVLPGLGVLFEILWNNSSKASQNKFVKTLHEHMQKQ